MELFEPDPEIVPHTPRHDLTLAQVDAVLTAQLIVGWAGEAGPDRRLGWWRSDFVNEYGGEDLFRRLLPATWRWAVLQGAREAARRVDAEARRRDHDPDRIISLFYMGHGVDERCEERLRDLKRSGMPPEDALPRLVGVIGHTWSPESFLEWVRDHGEADTMPSPIGRRIKSEPPASLPEVVRSLVASLAPLPDTYPLPHYRRTR